MTRAMNLEVAGVDLRRTPYCFEVNPSPGFTFYDLLAGQGLDRAIARHLMTPSS
jgi:D-alanine-D-alanine ligase-like ATP-grasp enzyme